jgi:hypothetical protein
MDDKLRSIMNLKSLSSESIDDFLSIYSAIIEGLIKNNDGTVIQYRDVINIVLMELYYRVKNNISFEKYDIDTFIYSLAYLAFRTQYKGKVKDRKAIVLNYNYYERGEVKLLSVEFSKKLAKCEEIINEIGEPGRTILRLSFYDNIKDEQILEHIHFETLEKLNNRRVKLIERCIESI